MNVKTRTIRPHMSLFKKTPLVKSIAAVLSLGSLVAISQTGLAAEGKLGYQLEEIVVTANKREQLASEIPASIGVVSGDDLNRMGATGLEDYFTAIPGLSLVDRGPGKNNVIVRGISNDSYGDTPTSALYFDEIPVSDIYYPDLHTFDVQRIEVLRGPQGTLYGAGSLGGTVRILTEKADPSEFNFKIDTTLESISGHDLGNRLNFMVNVPLADEKLAVRLVGYRHDTAGFYENVNAFHGDDNTGAERMDGGRLALRWLPTDKLIADFKYIYQKQDVDGYSAEQRSALVPLKKYQQDFASGGEQTDEIEVFSLDIIYDLGFATLTSATSLMEQENLLVENGNAWYYGEGQDQNNIYADPGFGDDSDIYVPISSNWTNENRAFSQEIRLVSQGSGPLNYTVGAFYSRSKIKQFAFEFVDPKNESHLALVNDVLDAFGVNGTDDCDNSGPVPVCDPNSFLYGDPDPDEEIVNQAIYGELSYDLSDQWTLIAGLRAFDLHMENDDDEVEDYDEDGVIPKLSVQFQVNDDAMLYATYSEGYRRGKFVDQVISPTEQLLLEDAGLTRAPGQYVPGDQPTLTQVLVTDANIENYCGEAYPNMSGQAVESDSLKNYELGAKLTLLDNRMQLNATTYYLDWSDIQLVQDVECGQGYTQPGAIRGNQGSMDIYGVEFDLSFQATERLLLNVSAGYLSSELQEDANLLPQGNSATLNGSFEEPLGVKGDRTPAVPELSYSLGGTYTFPLNLGAADEGYLDINYDYQGDSYTKYTERPEEKAGDYGIFDLRVGVVSDTWEAALFVHNVTDDDSVTYVDILSGTLGSNVTRVRPRTVGLNISYEF